MTIATITLIGGPTALIELDGFRLLTDPTFDDPGDYTLPHAILKKTAKPALAVDQIGGRRCRPPEPRPAFRQSRCLRARLPSKGGPGLHHLRGRCDLTDSHRWMGAFY